MMVKADSCFSKPSGSLAADLSLGAGWKRGVAASRRRFWRWKMVLQGARGRGDWM